MSLRVGWLALVLACGGGSMPVEKGEPQTAKEKQLQEARASGELDKPNPKFGGWRYQGERKDCFFVLGRRCFKTENAACQAAHCRTPKRCTTAGVGPATMTCR